MSRVSERGEFSPTVVSPSRINTYSTCGVAFKYNYIDRIPPERSGSAALFGTVVHAALEKWALDRSQQLVPLVREAWIDETHGTPVREFIEAYEPLSLQAIKLEHDIRQRRPEIRVVRMTKDWKTSKVGRDVANLLSSWHKRLNESYWGFTERDPLPALYDESLVLAARYADRYRSTPDAILVELKLSEEWEGFTLQGFVDAIEPTAVGDALLVTDYKTYRKAPAEMKDWRQLVMYDIALHSLRARGALDLPPLPFYVGVDYVRWTDDWRDEDGKPFPPRRYWEVTDADRERLLRELRAYKIAVENEVFLPANKSANPDFCDYPGICCLRNCLGAGGGMVRVEV